MSVLQAGLSQILSKACRGRILDFQLHPHPPVPVVASQPPYHMVAELSFPSQEAMGAALTSPEARAAST